MGKLKLGEILETYYNLSGKSSDVARQLAMVGVALIWIFKKEVQAQIVLPGQLKLPALLFVASLTFDILQYLSATAIWGSFHRLKERMGISEDQDVQIPRFLNWPALFFFWGKLTSCIVAYGFMLKFLSGEFKW